MLRVVLVDDEPLAREGMRDRLDAFPDIDVVGEADDFEAARSIIRRTSPDAIFLDIRMPGGDGFDLLREFENPPHVVFVTAYSSHAIQAFEVQAIDYLLKPVRPGRLADAVRRLREACGRTETQTPHPPDDRICLRSARQTIVVKLAHLRALQADGDFTQFHIAKADGPLICQKLGHYESILPNPPFVRVSRSFIINVECVTHVDRKARDSVSVHLAQIKEPIQLGRKAWQRLKPLVADAEPGAE